MSQEQASLCYVPTVCNHILSCAREGRGNVLLLYIIPDIAGCIGVCVIGGGGGGGGV